MHGVWSFVFASDLPRGPIKNNSMRIEILPSEVSTKVQERLDEQGANADFVTGVFLWTGLVCKRS